MARLVNITIDCANAEALRRFWLEALDGYELHEGDVVLKREGSPTIYFQEVPEPKRGKNRVHLDISAADRESEVRRLTSLGAKVLREMEEGGYQWTNMQDPEGNEFCVTRA